MPLPESADEAGQELGVRDAVAEEGVRVLYAGGIVSVRRVV